MISRNSKFFLSLISVVSISTQFNAAAPQERTQQLSNVASLPIAALGVYGSWKMLNTVESNSGIAADPYVSMAVKGGLSVLLGSYLYDVAHTVENYSAWPTQAVITLEEHLIWYQLLIALYKETCNHSAPAVLHFSQELLPFINECNETISKSFQRFDETSWKIGEQDLVKTFTQLQERFSQIAFGKCIAIQEIIASDLVQTDQVQELLEDFLVHLKNINLSAQSEHSLNQFIIVSQSLLRNLKNKDKEQQRKFEYVFAHCKRVEKLSTIGNMIHGGALYAKWYLSELCIKK